MDLNGMSLKELKDHQAQVAKAIASYEDRKKRDALAELEDKARSLGFSLAELTGQPAPRKRTASAGAKYRNPANAAETWTGRGRKPGWYISALASGRSEGDLRI